MDFSVVNSCRKMDTDIETLNDMHGRLLPGYDFTDILIVNRKRTGSKYIVNCFYMQSRRK